MAVRRSFILVAIVIHVLFAASRVNSDLTLFITRRFAETTLNLPVKNDIILLDNGEPNLVLETGQLFTKSTRPLSSNVLRVEMSWFATKNPVQYSLSVTSSNIEMMQNPRISIALQGVVKKTQTFEISLLCSGLVHGTVNVKFVLNYTNYKGSNVDRSSKRTLQFTVAKLCDNSHESSGEATPKKQINRTIIVSVCAVLACCLCLVVGVVFFRRFVKRIRKKFGFDDATERLPPLSQESCQSTINNLDSDSQVPTVVYSPKGNGFRKTFFTKIAKWEERKHGNSLQTKSGHCSRFYNAPPASESLSVNSSSSAREHVLSRDDRDVFSQVSIDEDDVFVAEQTDKVALIRNEHSPSSLTLAKESDSTNEMYSTLNEYWASQLGDSLKSLQEVDLRSEVIGEGAFGRVLRGKLRGQEEGACGSGQTPCIDLAVKVCQDGIEFEQMVSFVNEAILMKSLDHSNLINLLGVVLQPASPPLILTPLLSHGDLHKFLRHSRGIGSRRQLIGSRQLISFATQIACGMEYLSSKRIVHRDLAARNCFVDKDLNVKIGDFSLAKNVDQFNLHKMEHPSQLAVKWLALESLLYYIFTERSDIWSFGIVLWELVTLGSQPYAGLDNDEVTPYLETGKRLSRPLRCPDDLYAIMYSCWLTSPDERPTFSVLVHKLEDYEVRLRPSCIAFEFDEDTIEMNDGCENF